MDIEELISEVEKHTILWDVSNADYKDKGKKKEAWLHVASVVIPDFMQKMETERKIIVQEVTSKWRSVRDNYIRTLKKRNEHNKSGTVSKKKVRYLYEDRLGFLNKCREPRATSSSVKAEEDEPINTDSETNVIDELELIVNDDEAGEETNNEFKCPPRKKQKTFNLEEKLANFLEYTQNANDKDGDMAFYKSTLPLIKSFNLEQKMIYRMQLMQLIQNIRNQSVQTTP